MYRGSSPIFDVPEFPSLRKVKPLPNRRTSDISTAASYTSNSFVPSSASLGHHPLSLPGHDATAGDLLAHADSLSAQMAMQSYYMPIFGGVQDLFRSGLEDNQGTTTEFGNGYSMADRPGVGRGGSQEDDDPGGGDYMDHLQQPGNTKKRKVPANPSASPSGQDSGGGNSGGEEESTERSSSSGRTKHEAAEIVRAAPPMGILHQKQGKLSPTTLAGLQHKEMLKSRKRQLAAVLGALSHGDALALDQALSAHYPFLGSGLDDATNSQPPKIRLSRRRRLRLARAAKATRQPRHPDALPLRQCEFTFHCPSATSDRLIATKEEVAVLRARFEAELARQAAKAAKFAARDSKLAAMSSKGSNSKRSDRAQPRVRNAGTNAQSGEKVAEFLDQSLLGIKTRDKKKKRSALANASNPHHLKNYVPSRLPSAQSNVTGVAPQNYLGPFPFRFLSAEIPPRRKKTPPNITPMSLLTNPADEWICAFCEYELFYGGDQFYRRAVRMRKKVLRRRRRARERAAAAASGNSTTRVPGKNTPPQDDDDPEGDSVEADEVGTRSTKWKVDPNRDPREKAG